MVQIICESPVFKPSSLGVYVDRLSATVSAELTRLSAVQCASREAEEREACSSDNNWHWHTSGGVRWFSSTPFLTGSGGNKHGHLYHTLLTNWVHIKPKGISLEHSSSSDSTAGTRCDQSHIITKRFIYDSVALCGQKERLLKLLFFFFIEHAPVDCMIAPLGRH